MSIWNWLSAKEPECPECDGLKTAIKGNKQIVEQNIRMSKMSRNKSKELLQLGENALEILERTEKNK